MCNSKECANYFKSQQAYSRCLEELRRKWKSHGRVAGRITLERTSEAERRAIGGIIGKVFYEETIRFSFSEFEQGLQRTRFAPVTIKEVLEEYFGETLLTNQGQQREERDRKHNFLNRLCGYFEESADGESVAFLWAREMLLKKKYGYQLLMKEYGKDEKQAEVLARNVGKAVIKLEERRGTDEECPLAVFSAEISDNPHYFDRGTAAGLLLAHALCFREKTELPENAHQWRELLTRVSIVPDNVSSMVHAYGLRLRTGQGWHPAYDAFCKLKEPYVITMENLKGVTGVQAAGGRVYVVENEMVFSYLLGNLKKKEYTLLCTSGQPRSVVQVLIPYILAGGAEIYYNGDIDPDGIRIADRLWQKYGDSIHIWRMSPADYEESLSKERIGDMGRAKLEMISHPLLKRTAECMKEKQLAAYQENMLKVLVEDIFCVPRTG